jgi:hypothetical protein
VGLTGTLAVSMKGPRAFVLHRLSAFLADDSPEIGRSAT